VALRFSVMLPQTNSVASRDAILRVAETAEELDFDAVTVHDHLVGQMRLIHDEVMPAFA